MQCVLMKEGMCLPNIKWEIRQGLIEQVTLELELFRWEVVKASKMKVFQE